MYCCSSSELYLDNDLQVTIKNHGRFVSSIDLAFQICNYVRSDKGNRLENFNRRWYICANRDCDPESPMDSDAAKVYNERILY